MAQHPPADVDRTTRCPACGAGLRGDAPWCTQCWLDLRTPEPEPEPEPEAQPEAPAQVEPVACAAAPVDAGWPCPCGASNELARDACATCGAGLFDALRQDGGPALALPVLGDVAGLTKVQLGAAAAVLLAVLLAGLLAVLALAGALLT